MSLSRAVGVLLQAAIRVYQLVISGLFPQACRFEPSCSQYGIEAIAEHGPVRGSWLTLRRIARCHPFSPGGFDSVPRGERRGS
ncbi:MAG: membrane protein insertion efficiency factor YidD [Myxococcota bacterium]